MEKIYEKRESGVRAYAGRTLRFLLVSKLALIGALAGLAIPMAAFEAHIVNVTAVIERKPAQCDALSIGYWKNHDGCSKGKGNSIWTNQVHVITTEFSGLFYDISGSQICSAVDIGKCPRGNDPDAARCKAKGMALADELNLVAGHLDLDALIAGADDGSSAFDHLGLNYNSTVRQALTVIEMIISESYATSQKLNDAAYVAERIYAFYEDENPIKPLCVYTRITLPPPGTCGSGTSTTPSISGSSSTGDCSGKSGNGWNSSLSLSSIDASPVSHDTISSSEATSTPSEVGTATTSANSLESPLATSSQEFIWSAPTTATGTPETTAATSSEFSSSATSTR